MTDPTQQRTVPAAGAQAAAGRKDFRQRMLDILRIPEVGVLIPLVLLLIIFQCLSPSFLYRDSVLAMLRGLSLIGIIAVGQTFLLVVGELDLSVGTVAGLCAIVVAWLMAIKGWPAAAAVPAGVLVGATTGMVNAAIAVYWGVPAFITTLGMMYVAKGINYLICNGSPIAPLPKSIKDFGDAKPLGMSWGLIIFLTAVLVGDQVLRRTVFGRAVYATGGNKEVAHLAGINTKLVKASCYVLTGMLAAVAGMLAMAKHNAGTPEMGTGWELDIIAAVVIGGVSLFGGAGTVLGTLFGLMIMIVVRNGLVSADVNTHWQTVAVGVIMVLAVGIDLIRRRAKIH